MVLSTPQMQTFCFILRPRILIPKSHLLFFILENTVPYLQGFIHQPPTSAILPKHTLIIFYSLAFGFGFLYIQANNICFTNKSLCLGYSPQQYSKEKFHLLMCLSLGLLCALVFHFQIFIYHVASISICVRFYKDCYLKHI